MKRFNIIIAVLAAVLVALIVVSIARKEWYNLFNNVCWLASLVVSAMAVNQADNMYEMAQYFISHTEEEEKEDDDESQD